jgi:hypothetical protein
MVAFEAGDFSLEIAVLLARQEAQLVEHAQFGRCLCKVPAC